MNTTKPNKKKDDNYSYVLIILLIIVLNIIYSNTAFAFKNGFYFDNQAHWNSVGEVGSGTGTLITLDRVLTAAHCVCVALRNGQMDCAKQASFRITLANGSFVKLNGRVDVYPGYRRIKENLHQGIDLAVIMLDENSKQIVNNAYQSGLSSPTSLTSPQYYPSIGTPFALIGFGPADPQCQGPIGRKNIITLVLHSISSTEMKFVNPAKHACDGDSGGPVLSANTVVGVVTDANFGGLTSCILIRPFFGWIMGPH